MDSCSPSTQFALPDEKDWFIKHHLLTVVELDTIYSFNQIKINIIPADDATSLLHQAFDQIRPHHTLDKLSSAEKAALEDLFQGSITAARAQCSERQSSQLWETYDNLPTEEQPKWINLCLQHTETTYTGLQAQISRLASRTHRSSTMHRPPNPKKRPKLADSKRPPRRSARLTSREKDQPRRSQRIASRRGRAVA